MTSPTDRDTLDAARESVARDFVDRAARERGEELHEGRIEVAQEFATVGVERRDTGGVRVRLVTDADEEMRRVDLASETVEVSRQPVGREIDAIPAPREEGDVLIVPVVEERAVVVTKLFLTEEIHIRRARSTQSVDVPVKLRRQRAVVERLEPGLSDPDRETVSTGPIDLHP